MIVRNIRALVSRDWDRVRRSKDDYWRTRITRLGAAEGLRVADELRRQAILLAPAWPDVDDRRRDLLAHVRLASRFRRAGSTRRA